MTAPAPAAHWQPAYRDRVEARLRRVIEQERPHLIVPEIEAIATDTLVAMEQEGWNVIPTARAAQLTMNREGIRRLAAESLGLATSPFRFADTHADYVAAVRAVGMPCVVKPVMSSSGKGQSTVKTEADIDQAWQYAQDSGGAGAGVAVRVRHRADPRVLARARRPAGNGRR